MVEAGLMHVITQVSITSGWRLVRREVEPRGPSRKSEQDRDAGQGARLCRGRKLGCLRTERGGPVCSELSQKRELGRRLDWRQAEAKPCWAWCWVLPQEHCDTVAAFQAAE